MFDLLEKDGLPLPQDYISLLLPIREAITAHGSTISALAQQFVFMDSEFISSADSMTELALMHWDGSILLTCFINYSEFPKILLKLEATSQFQRYLHDKRLT